MNRPEFLDFVASAVHSADRPEIARVDTVLAALDDPSGLRITMTDGDVLLLRVLTTTARRPAIPAPPPVPPPVVPPSTAGGNGRVALGDAFPRAITPPGATPHSPEGGG